MNTKTPKQLKTRVIRAGYFTLVGFMISQILRFGSNLILTRLLVPEMFGIMALVTVIIIGLGLFSDIGLQPNIVQSKRGEEPDFVNTAWVIQITRGILLTIICLVISWSLFIASENGWLAENTVYSDPILPTIVAVMSVIALISGFESTKLLLAARNLSLGWITVVELISQILGLAVIITWAWYERTIWALVSGGIVTSVVKTILSHLIVPGISNKLFWEKRAFYEIFHFGKWIFLSSITGYLLNQGDKLLLGGLVSAEVMGVYTIAFFIANAVMLVLQKINRSVLFPALSEVVRTNKDRLQDVYYKTRLRIDGVTMFSAGFLFVSGNSIINLLYDDRYTDAGWMLSILSISLISVGYLLSDQVFLALGQARNLSFLSLLQIITLYSLLPVLFYYFGMVGAMWVIALNFIPKVIVSIIIMRHYKILNPLKEIRMFPVLILGYIVGYVFNLGVS